MGKCTEIETLWSTGLYKMMLLEMIICSVSPIPFFYVIIDDKFHITNYYSSPLVTESSYWEVCEYIQSILLLLMFSWIYLLFRVILITTFMDEKSYWVCKLNDCEPSYLFSFWCLFWTYHYQFVILNFAFFVVTLSYLVWLFDHKKVWNSYSTVIWMVIVSMITVGYGDYTPKSSVGSMVCLFAIYFGLYILGLFVICYFLNFTW